MIEWGLTEKEFDNISELRIGRILDMRQALVEGQTAKHRHQESLAKSKRGKK